MNSLTKQSPADSIHVIEPLPDTILPPDMASPLFVWEDPVNNAAWLITLKSDEKILLKAMLSTQWWIPEANTWEELKMAAGQKTIQVIIEGIGGWNGREILSESSIDLHFSKNRVDARLMFIRKPLPFLKAAKNPGLSQILAGNISAYEKPEVVVSRVNTCFNCHSYSSEGNVFALDINYKGDKGGFAMTFFPGIRFRSKSRLCKAWDCSGNCHRMAILSLQQ